MIMEFAFHNEIAIPPADTPSVSAANLYIPVFGSDVKENEGSAAVPFPARNTLEDVPPEPILHTSTPPIAKRKSPTAFL